MSDHKYMVRITCMTYNHAPYITDAMNGFVMQRTDFPFVCIIIDDASTDGEPELIRKYVGEYFDLQETSIAYDKDTDYGHVTYARHKTNKNCFFAVVYLNENHYSQKKAKSPYLTEWLDAKYVAFCEGDDFWTDSLKLQKEVDILESDDGLMGVVTNSCTVDRSGNMLESKWKNVVPNNREGRYDLRSYIKNGHHYPTATVCYRLTHGEEIASLRKKLANQYFSDWTTWLVLHIFGDFYYIDQVTSSYRINPTSVTHTYDRVGRSKVNWKINEALRDVVPEEYEDIHKALNNKTWLWIDLGFAYRHEHQHLRMLWCFFVAFMKNPKELMDEYKRRKKAKKSV